MKNRVIIQNNLLVPGCVRPAVGPDKLKEQRAAVSAAPPKIEIRGDWERLCLAVAVCTMALLLCSTAALAGTVQLPQTGQTKCYEGVSPYAEIPCAGTGQDGDKQMGAAWASDMRFTAGTGAEADCVTDNLTGLTWVKSPDSTIRTFQAAIDYAEGLDLCGFDDWRVPSVIELESMVNAEQPLSADWLNTQGFSNVKSANYRSSTNYMGYTGYTWYVDLGYGSAGSVNRLSSFYVWPVRGGQAGASADIWATGQKTCYDTTGSVVPCSGTEQDGDLQPGVAWPSPRFTNNGNGTVTDNLTGLIWLSNANCGYMTWANALTWSTSFASGSCGLSDGSAAGDWRLPNRKELLSLVDFEYYTPALSNASGTAKWSSGNPFVNVQSGHYWSSTTYAYDSLGAWYVNMNDGHSTSYNKAYSLFVWPVRGGYFAITVSEGANGTAACSPNPVIYNESSICTITPDTGYHIAGVGGTCGGSLVGNTYTTEAITSNCTVAAAFEINNVLRVSSGNIETGYTWIQDAFDEAEDGDTILIRDLSFSENPYFDQEGISVLIQGGCDTDFIPITGYYSTVQSIEIRRGTVEVENLVLQ